MSSSTREGGSAAPHSVYTIGHSNHPIERFLDLLARHEIAGIADVRSHPYSRFSPQFSLKRLSASLEAAGIAYLFFGRELGARSDDPATVVDGRVDYDRLARTQRFQDGLGRVADTAANARIALMCAERDPFECHRAILVCPALAARGIESQHIREDGRLESRAELEARLLDSAGPAQRTGDLFPDLSTDRDERVALAYRRRGVQIAFRVRGSTGSR
jgi:uncharacterized protein (DUF488 family)